MKSVGLMLLGFSHTLLKPVWLSRPFTRPNHASVEGREEISRYASFNRGEISQLVAIIIIIITITITSYYYCIYCLVV